VDRSAKILAEIPRGSKVIELGPSYAPIAPKSDGWDSLIVDHGSRETLVAKYRSVDTVDVSRIEDVDVVWRGGPLDQAIPATSRGSYDAFIASHVVEHIPDPVGLLESLAVLLKPTGVVSLVVPDKRFCFDFFKPISTTGELLLAHEQRASRHARSALFNEVAYGVTNAGSICWGRRPATELAFFRSLYEAKRQLDEYGTSEDGPYVDCHAWFFTPASFQLAMLELAALEVIDFTVNTLFPTEDCEFYVTLRRGRQIPRDENELEALRLDLLRETFTEIGEQIGLLTEGAPGGITRESAGSVEQSILEAGWTRLAGLKRRLRRGRRTIAR